VGTGWCRTPRHRSTSWRSNARSRSMHGLVAAPWFFLVTVPRCHHMKILSSGVAAALAWMKTFSPLLHSHGRAVTTAPTDPGRPQQNSRVEGNPIFSRLVYRQPLQAVSRLEFCNLPVQAYLEASSMGSLSSGAMGGIKLFQFLDKFR
jgi:hypothetical protein